MCIMEVRPGQASSTIAMALAHNTTTIGGDLDFFEKLVAARGETVLLAQLQQAHDHLRRAYADLLAVFGEEIASEVQSPEGHVHQHDHVGNERSLVEQAHHDAGLARQFMTR